MDSLTVLSPAKLNLHLRILGKRRNGYHSLVTVFHRISLADRLRLSKRKEGFSLQISTAALPSDEANLITRAYRLLEKELPRIGGIDVRLEKNIPIGAGLGGGSSNAAAFLLGIKRLYGLPLSKKKLLNLGEKLGADVPFFIRGIHQAVGWGIGEKLEAVSCRKKYYFVLVLPAKPLSTAEVYRRCRPQKPASLTKEKAVAKILCRCLNKGELSKAAMFQRNDLQQAAIELQPSIERVMTKGFRAGRAKFQMTGSGPTVYSAFPEIGQARKLQKHLSKVFKPNRIVLCQSY